MSLFWRSSGIHSNQLYQTSWMMFAARKRQNDLLADPSLLIIRTQLISTVVCSLSVGSRVLLYDESPFHPDLRSFFKLINDQGLVIYIRNFSPVPGWYLSRHFWQS